MSERQDPSSSGWTEHLAPMGPGWSVWRQMGLRGAGFPAALAQRVRQPESAQAAEALLAREKELRAQGLKASAVQAALEPERARFVERYAAEATRVGQALREVVHMPEFREAVAWQNRDALTSAFEVLLRRDASQRDSSTSQKEDLVYKYLLRYCLKNDTIGFFGPLGWGRIDPEAKDFSLEPGPGLVSRRRTLFEHWCLDTLAEQLSKDVRLRPWISPRRLPIVRLEGRVAIPLMGEGTELSAASARALELCDGVRTAREIATLLRQDPALGVSSEAEVMAILEEHQQQWRVRWALELPNIEPHPERVLRGLLERIDDAALRAEALAPLDQLEALRDQVARSAGDAEATVRSLDALNEAFTQRTGEKSQRRAGQMYAGRTLLYQDCNRDVTLQLGTELLQRISPALGMVVDSARWLSFQLGKLYLAAFDKMFDELRGDAPTVDLMMFQMAVGELFPFVTKGPHGPPPEAAKDLLAELQRRWGQLLRLTPGERRIQRSSAELATAARELFSAPGPGWPMARHHSPDMMIAAASPEAVRRGEFLAVLGELHIAINSLESPVFFFQHPRQEELVHALEQDLAGPRVAPVVPKDRATRAALVPFNRDSRDLAYDATRSRLPPSQVLAVSDMVVERVDGQLHARTRDGSFRCHLMELNDWSLSVQFASSMRLLPPLARSPRVTIDNLVVARETWRFPTAELPFLKLHDPTARFLEARRWARQHELPEQVFFKTPNETKPFFLDLASPLSLKTFVKMARGSESVVISEMLPTPEELWLRDAQGRTYTSELRMVVVDAQPWRRPT